MEDKQLPISQYLIKLATPGLSDVQYQICNMVINQLVDRLDEGCSCINLKSVTDVPVANILEALTSAGLASILQVRAKLLVKPLTILAIAQDEYLLYITRYMYYEQSIVEQMFNLTNISSNYNGTHYMDLHAQLVDTGFPNQEQLAAIDSCCNNQLSIITGGPGTGKTTTVTLLLWLLTAVYSKLSLKIWVCAPTGKAAARVRESIYNSLKTIPLIDMALLNNYFNGNPVEAINFTTIHKLLGYISGNIYFRHNVSNPIDVDILIVDEASMVSLPLFHKLLMAIDSKRTRHIIFLGDKNQLSSVEEGYVFASLVGHPDRFNIQALNVSKRNTGMVGELAGFILQQQDERVIACLTQNKAMFSLNLNNILNDLFDPCRANSIIPYLSYIQQNALSTVVGDIELHGMEDELVQLFRWFQNLVVLCAVNKGKFGMENLNKHIETKVKQHLQQTALWYSGRPIMILENDYALDLHNGDIGICWWRKDRFVIVFEDGKTFIPEVLPYHQLAYAISIHKSQGSEYTNVVVVLPESGENGLYNRELLYTAVTRARTTVVIYAEENTLRHVIKKIMYRESGLKPMIQFY